MNLGSLQQRLRYSVHGKQSLDLVLAARTGHASHPVAWDLVSVCCATYACFDAATQSVNPLKGLLVVFGHIDMVLRQMCGVSLSSRLCQGCF